MQTKIYQQTKSSRQETPTGNNGRTSITDNRISSVMQQKMAKAILQKANDKELVQDKLISQQVENKTGMPDNLKAGVEKLSGLDMSDVRVHYNSSKPANVQAHAYTQGTNIHVAPGQEQHLGHEAWHVAQQKQGRVQPTTTVAGMPVNDNPGLEAEADRMGARASLL